MALSSSTLNTLSFLHCSPKIEVKAANKWRPSCAATRSQSQDNSKSRDSASGRSYRKVWRRRNLTKRDDFSVYGRERVPFLEEQVRKIRETGEIVSMDIERLLLSEENRFAFVNDVAAEANRYVENNRDEYGSKKAILHVLSNRMNDLGFNRPEAYLEDDPYKPGPGFLKQEVFND
ncbi:plastid transcriptionally active7 [Striga hermonthica]|uniref:Plastid transcriptionally active7 n=1 Tax=Striga hermonthica TaxID=68872 RepID=A0A9N7MS55_STRHE|nr:plastid transcriptionally active7 [Striga hermonthica]